MDNNRQEGEQKQQRQKGPVDYINNLRSIVNFSKLLKGIGGSGHAPEGSGKELQAAAKLAMQAINSFPVTRAVTIGIVIAIFLILFIVFFFSGGGGGSSILNGGGGGGSEQGPGGGGAPQFPPIPGLTLTLTGPTVIGNGEHISYSVTVVYDSGSATVPIEEITVFHQLPQNTSFSSATGIFTNNQGLVSWPLSEVDNQSGFTFTLAPTQSDFFIDAQVYAQAAPPSSGGTGGVCSEGFGHCSIQNLTNYFGDPAVAAQASVICNRESGSDPGALNDGCLDGSSLDYSVGLFQINLLAHCPGAFSHNNNASSPTCTILNQATLDQCYARFSDPVQNINYAKQLYSSSGWQPWSAATACGIDYNNPNI